MLRSVWAATPRQVASNRHLKGRQQCNRGDEPRNGMAPPLCWQHASCHARDLPSLLAAPAIFPPPQDGADIKSHSIATSGGRATASL